MAGSFEYSCGETVTVALDIIGGDSTFSDVASITADLRRGARGVRTVSVDSPLVASFAVTAKAGNTGWWLKIPAATSASIPPGYYLVDARLTLTNGEIIVTEQLPVRMIPAVTRP